MTSERTETSAGGAICPTPCDPDCDAGCHEMHDVPAKREHQPEDCPRRRALDRARDELSKPDSFRRDLDRHMQDPEFRRSYEEQTRRLEAGAAGAGWWPVMADKRLGDIGKALVVADGRTIAHELYDEVQRLRTLEESYRGDVQRLRDRAEKVEAELKRCAGLNRELVNEAADFRVERDEARAELAELRAMLRPEYGLRYPSNKSGDPDEQLVADDEATARLLAAHGDTIMRRLRTDWEEVPNAEPAQ